VAGNIALQIPDMAAVGSLRSVNNGMIVCHLLRGVVKWKEMRRFLACCRILMT